MCKIHKWVKVSKFFFINLCVDVGTDPMCLIPAEGTSRMLFGMNIFEEKVIVPVVVVLHILNMSSMGFSVPQFSSDTLLKKGMRNEDCM